jgi:glyoxylase-like metal-dependent hydrolase (beta-lactamase superfamily II)
LSVTRYLSPHGVIILPFGTGTLGEREAGGVKSELGVYITPLASSDDATRVSRTEDGRSRDEVAPPTRRRPSTRYREKHFRTVWCSRIGPAVVDPTTELVKPSSNRECEAQTGRVSVVQTMNTELLWGETETRDGAAVFGPHGVSAASRTRPGTSSGVYLIRSGDEALLVDTGRRTAPEYPTGVLDTICDVIDERDVRLRYVVQTHFHYDHVGNTQHLKDRYGATVLCHAQDRPVIEDPTILASTEYIESMGGDPATIAAELTLDDPSDITASKALVREHWNHPVEVDRTVEDGDTVTLGELELRVLHTPGHTPGHLSVYNPSSNSLYLADVMYWPTPLHPYPMGNVAEQIASVEKCLTLEADSLFSGHGLPRFGADAVEDYLRELLLRGRQLEERILVLLSRHGELTIPDLHAETFVIKERYDYANDGWFANSMNCIHAHLRRLLEAKEVRRVERENGTVAWEVTEDGQRPAEETGVEGAYERTKTLADIPRT